MDEQTLTPQQAAQIRHIVTEALLDIFDITRVTDRLDEGPVHTAVLRYVSRISKVHEDTAIKNIVTTALENAFDVYKHVHEMEERHMRQIIYEYLYGVLDKAPQTWSGQHTVVDSMYTEIAKKMKESLTL